MIRETTETYKFLFVRINENSKKKALKSSAHYEALYILSFIINEK